MSFPEAVCGNLAAQIPQPDREIVYTDCRSWDHERHDHATQVLMIATIIRW